MGIGPNREVPERRGLIAGGIGKFGPAVSDLTGEQSRQPIEVSAPLGIPDVTPLTTLHDSHAVDGAAKDREVAPEMSLGKIVEIVCGHICVPRVASRVVPHQSSSASCAISPTQWRQHRNRSGCAWGLDW